jgi:hypothetical protein
MGGCLPPNSFAVRRNLPPEDIFEQMKGTEIRPKDGRTLQIFLQFANDVTFCTGFAKICRPETGHSANILSQARLARR